MYFKLLKSSSQAIICSQLFVKIENNVLQIFSWEEKIKKSNFQELIKLNICKTSQVRDPDPAIYN